MALLDLLALLNDLSRRPKIALLLLVGILLGGTALFVLPSNDYKIYVFIGSILLFLTVGIVWHFKTEPNP